MNKKADVTWANIVTAVIVVIAIAVLIIMMTKGLGTASTDTKEKTDTQKADLEECIRDSTKCDSIGEGRSNAESGGES